MALVVKEESGQQRKYAPLPPAPSGTHAARCVGLFDLGRQDVTYQGEKKVQNKLMLQFELVNEMLTLDTEEGPKEVPHVISREFTASLSPKGNLRPILESWRGRPFTDGELQGFKMANVLGTACLVNIVHKKRSTPEGEKTYANLASTAAPMKGMNIQAPATTPRLFDMDEIDYEVLATIPKWIQEKIRASLDFPKTAPAAPVAEAASVPVVEEDDIPF